MEYEAGPSGELITKATMAGYSLVPGYPSLLGRVFGPIFEGFSGQWQRHIVVESTQNILAFSAVYACVALISGDVAKLRPKLVRLAKDGIWDEVVQGSPFLTVLRKPNRYQTRIQFLQYWVASKLLYGNAYVLKERDGRGVVTQLYGLDPRSVTPMVAPDGEVFYQFGADNLVGSPLGETGIPASEIIHDRMTTLWHPLCGVSPIYACGASATQGIRIQNNSEAFFSNMSRPSGMLTTPGVIPQETAIRLKAEWEANYGGFNLGRVFVGGSGLKYEPMTVPAQDAQLIEQQKWTVEDVCRAFGVPLYKVSAGAYPNLTGIGALNQDYYNQTLQLQIESIELLLDEALGLPALGMGTELELENLLRMDPKSRAETAEIEMRSALITPNEGRANENRHQVVGGNTPYLQQQQFSLAALAKRDALADPFNITQPEAPAEPEPEEPDNDEEDKSHMAMMKLISRFNRATYAEPV